MGIFEEGVLILALQILNGLAIKIAEVSHLLAIDHAVAEADGFEAPLAGLDHGQFKILLRDGTLHLLQQGLGRLVVGRGLGTDQQERGQQNTAGLAHVLIPKSVIPESACLAADAVATGGHAGKH